MNNFWQRAITGTVFVAVVCALTLVGEIGFLTLLCLIAVGGLYEFYSIVLKRKPALKEFLVCLAAVIVLLLNTKYNTNIHVLSIIIGLIAINELLSKDRSWLRLIWYGAGLLYILLPLLLFYKATRTVEIPGIGSSYQYTLALNLFILIWCSDTFAYISGKLFGKHKLYEKVSPGKTVEGFIGAIVLTVGFSLLLSIYTGIPYKINMLVAFFSVVFGTLGDLVESQLKREFDIKDSGNIMPGHGGILDRFDALLFSLPFTTAVYSFFL